MLSGKSAPAGNQKTYDAGCLTGNTSLGGCERRCGGETPDISPFHMREKE